MGARHKPVYRIVVADSSRARDGKYIEAVGYYDPRAKSTKIEQERIDYWISKGAKPTNTVGKLLIKSKRTRVVEPEITRGGENEGTG